MTKQPHNLEKHDRTFALLAMAGSFLLFFVQPLIAKIALPQLGGSPAVWNSAMAAYQLLLLTGYIYAHALQRLAVRQQKFAHVLLLMLSMLWLPISFKAEQVPTGENVVLWVPWQVSVAVGPLFLLLAAQAPLLQSWQGRDRSTAGLYGLYIWSNIGSFLGLLSYPLLIDPIITVSAQTTFWSWGYMGFVAAMAAFALRLSRQENTEPVTTVPSSEGRTQWPSWKRGLKWLVLAAVPSALILSTTTHLTTDIMALPLLWVLPLALYLLSFVIAFSANSRLASVLVQNARLPLALLGILSLSTDAFEVAVTGLASITFLLVAGVALHRQLFNERPEAEGLTAFYIILAAGGALGGMLVAIFAPLIFNWSYEYPILVIAAIALAYQESKARSSAMTVAIVAIAFGIVVIVFVDWHRPEQIWLAAAFATLLLLTWQHKLALLAVSTCAVLTLSVLDALLLNSYGLHQRSYFGIYSISENLTGTIRTLAHGNTNHGAQHLETGELLQPSTYFGRQSGVGQILEAAEGNARIGVLGMGVGTLACYAQPDQSWSFYEIDPLVVDISTKQGWFTFIPNCTPDAVVRIGDARLTLAQQPSNSLDILVIDVFSSDSIPTHLITQEAFDIYDRVLAPKGLLLLHISNRYLDLEPVITSEVNARGWSALLNKHHPTDDEFANGETTSVWVLMSRSKDQLAQTLEAIRPEFSTPQDNWRALKSQANFLRWTDDHSSILSLLWPDSE